MSISGDFLADGQLAASETAMYTVPASTRAYVKMIICANTHASHQNLIQLWILRSGGTHRKVVNLNTLDGEVLYDDTPKVLEAGDKIQGMATNASEVDYTIYGGTEAV